MAATHCVFVWFTILKTFVIMESLYDDVGKQLMHVGMEVRAWPSLNVKRAHIKSKISRIPLCSASTSLAETT